MKLTLVFFTELGSHILAQNSVPRENWLPPLFISKTLHNQTVPSGDSNSSRTSSPSSSACDPIMQHKFKRKCLADVIESLIGCFVCYSSLELAFQFTHKFLDISVLPSNSEGSFKIQSPRCTDERTSLLMDEEVKLLVGLDKIEKGLKYTFNEKLWLVQALTHATYFRNSITSNYQRLEFLGDAILDFLITRHIHNTYKNMDPGKLTDLRSALVNNVLFASLSVQLGLHRALKHMSSKLDYEIDKFVKFVTSTSVSSLIFAEIRKTTPLILRAIPLDRFVKCNSIGHPFLEKVKTKRRLIYLENNKRENAQLFLAAIRGLEFNWFLENLSDNYIDSYLLP